VDRGQDAGLTVRPQQTPAVADGPVVSVPDAQHAGVLRSRAHGWTSEGSLTAVAFAVSAVVLFVAYYDQARQFAVGVDGSSNLLQAWDMLHGNLLLSGWTLADLSFYTVELPEYAIVAAVRGLGPGAIYAGAALTYTAVVLLAALLAKGRATGRTGLIRALIGGGIMLAPTWGGLLGNPDHIGTQAPLLLMWIILDRAGRRWWVPVVSGVLLAWTQVSDPLALYEGVLPLAAVCVLRMYRRRLADDPGAVPWRGFVRGNWYEASLAVAAFAGAAASALALRLISMAGGFTVVSPATVFASVQDFASRIGVTAESVLLLYGADFSKQPLRASSYALIHLAGVSLAAWALARAYRRFWQHDLVTQVLAVAAGVLLLAYTFTGAYTVGSGTHEINGLLPIGAVLAGRLLATPLARARLLPVLAVVGVAYSFVLVHEAVRTPPPVSHDASIAAWLQAHHLDRGLSTYWDANLITVVTGNRVQIRPVGIQHGQLAVSPWDSDASWYDKAPDKPYTFFLVTTNYSGCPRPAGSRAYWLSSIQRTFGPPMADYRNIYGYDVLVWNHNLLGVRLPQTPPRFPPTC
jgi:hypothetical protein